jgi:hypothetical protein
VNDNFISINWCDLKSSEASYKVNYVDVVATAVGNELFRR